MSMRLRKVYRESKFRIVWQREYHLLGLMQLLNDAAKQSYIDKFLERNQNCTDFSVGIQKALNGEDAENYGWFLS